MIRKRSLVAQPLYLMLLAASLYIVALLVNVSYLTTQPWMGVEFDWGTPGVGTVVRLADSAPSDDASLIGRQLSGLQCDGRPVAFSDVTFVQDPEETPDFASYRRFFEHQDELAECLNGKQVQLLLTSGEGLPVVVAPARPLLSLPAGYWITQTLGLGTLVFAIGVWSHRPGQRANQLILVWGIALAFIVHSMSIYGFRELAVPAQTFQLAHAINRIALYTMSFTVLLLILVHPQPLVRPSRQRLVIGIGGLLLGNELLQLFDWPPHSFYVPLLLVYLYVIFALWRQWRSSRLVGRERAAILWFFLSIVIANGGAIVFYALPAVLGHPPLTALWVGQGFFFIMFLGFSLSVIRFRLFDIERWWLNTWLWLSAALLVVALDSLLVIWLHLQPHSALSISILLVAWLYLPLRQWVWDKVLHHGRVNLEHHLPRILAHQVAAPDAQAIVANWPQLLSQIYNSAEIRQVPGDVDNVALLKQGGELAIPSLASGTHLVLAGKHGGSRLFGRQDLRLARDLLNLSKSVLQARTEQDRGIEAERQRIMRDLHDDVGAQLLAVVHTPDLAQSQSLAKQALGSLRDIVYAICPTPATRPLPLSNVLASLRQEIAARLAPLGIALDWQVPATLDATLSPRQGINLGSILRELTSNALKHAEPTYLQVCVSDSDGILQLSIRHDGVSGHEAPEHWCHGAGLSSIRVRAREIHAECCWTLRPGQPLSLECDLSMPISESRAGP